MASKTYNGIDVSHHNGLIRWNDVKTDFAIIRAGYGKSQHQTDRKFEYNYSGCIANNIPCGAYWYSYATTVEEAREEAKAFLTVIKGKKFSYPVFYDVEEERTFSCGKEKVSEIISAFCEEVEKAGYFVGVYMSSSALTSYVTEEVRNRYSIWVAHWGVKNPSYDGTYGMWQFSATGAVKGINGDVDLDKSYRNFPSVMLKNHLNGY